MGKPICNDYHRIFAWCRVTGQERDAETGLDFFQARYYGAALGRFTSPDPMNEGADLTNPQSWNGYAYVNNSPLSATDPTGLFSFSDIFQGIGNFFGDVGSAVSNWFNPPCGSDFCVTGTSKSDINTASVGLGGGLVTGGAGGLASGGEGSATFTATGLGKADISNASTPAQQPLQPSQSVAQNKASACFAQLKSRPVNDPTASKVNALHTFWWMQGTNGRAIISAGPQSYQGGSNPYLEAWVVPGNSNGADNSGQHLVFDTGVSSDVCGQVNLMINSASQFPRRSFYYNPVWGPNSNTAAKYFGTKAGFQPNFPFNAYGSGAPLLVP